MNSWVIVDRDFGASTATIAPSWLSGPFAPVITSSSTTAVPVDCAKAPSARRSPVARAVEAHSASPALARDLGITRHAPVLKLTTVSVGTDNLPVETFVAYHRGDRSRFEVEVERTADGRAAPPLVRVI